MDIKVGDIVTVRGAKAAGDAIESILHHLVQFWYI